MNPTGNWTTDVRNGARRGIGRRMYRRLIDNAIGTHFFLGKMPRRYSDQPLLVNK